ncbi:MAG: cysteine hydrolase [Spirochaetes bacterium]|nr:cysteine hydrolase [Spirochaetota bacterium]
MAGHATSALIVVDMQNYYIKRDSQYYRYFNALQPGCLDYIINRCETAVIPNIQRLQRHFRSRSLPILYLRLCGRADDRSDLHRFFWETNRNAERAGFDGVYPLEQDPPADIIEEIKPLPSEAVINKTTFSPFTGTDFERVLRDLCVASLVFTGLSTSQCVETTARDASDRGFHVIHIEDAQADYDELHHTSSLFCSQAVCGGYIMTTEEYIEMNE